MIRKIIVFMMISLSFTGMLFAGTVGTVKGVPQASLTLQNTNMALGHCNYADWTLEKTTSTPEITDAGTAEWTVTVTKVSISGSYLNVFGYMTVYNSGSGPATIGNILVNLQTNRIVSGKNRWVSASVNVANATNGDAATVVNTLATASQENPAWNAVYNLPKTYLVSGAKGTFYENSTSGKLEFTDADSNTVWALTPQQSIPAGGTVNLKFEAEFNNSIMQIPEGASVRAEVIVSFGNSGSRGGSGASGAKIDINGNALIDADEAYIRSVPSRITMTVPELITCNDTVTLRDPEAITDGSVSLENFNNGGIDEGAVIGAGDPAGSSYVYNVSADVTAGELGGAVYNTAYLDGEDILVPVQTGQNPIYDDFGILVGYEPIYYYALCCEGICLEASSKVIVNPVIQEDENLLINGDFETFDRTGQGWNNKNGGHKFLEDNWSSICSSGNVSVGDHFKMTFTSADAIEKYLPTGGTPGVLTANMTDPTSTSAKVFGGNVLALCLNLDSSSAGITPAGFGDLLLANLVEGAVDVKLTLTADEAAALNGQTISQVLADAEHVLGGNGASSAYGLDTSKLNALTEILNESCISGDISPFAELHLRKP